MAIAPQTMASVAAAEHRVESAQNFFERCVSVEGGGCPRWTLRKRLGLVVCREMARHRIRRVPYIGVPRAVVERRMQRGQLVGGPQARVPLYVPYADFFQFQAGAGRLAAAGA